MVISRPTNIFFANQQISSAKLHQLQHQLKQLALVHCVIFIQYKMPSLPQAAFAVCKIREQKSRPSRSQGGADGSNSLYNQNIMELMPVKYNEKYMNAIWGIYNRYSPHNIKSNDAAIAISNRSQNLMLAAITAPASLKPFL